MSTKPGGKGRAGASKGKQIVKAGAEQQTEDVLQAVVIADTFQERFRPFSLEMPRCLMPLANTPMIEYTLEFLAMSGVQEVFIYCKNHLEKIEEYLQKSRWNPESSESSSPFSSVDFIRVADATSMGDFLRDLDKRALINGDFILVHGDLVANMPMDSILAKHRARREKNRDACLTIALRTGGDSHHRTKSKAITPIFTVDSTTGRCLHYEEMHPLQTVRRTSLDLSALDGVTDFEMRSDLIDCGIDICTPDVLALWSESFDYELPRKNFLHGVLKDWELNGKLIYVEILESGYAARASNMQMYESISRDIIGRWTFPMVPDSNLLPSQTYRRQNGASLVEKEVHMAASVGLSTSVVGTATTIGEGSTITNSVIGSRCKIGRNVSIENSFLWDDSVVGDGTTVSRSILASSVVVGQNCVIPEGSLLSFGVQVADDFHPPNDQPGTVMLSLVEGAFSREQSDEDDEDEDNDPSRLQKSLIYSLNGLDLSLSSISTFASDDEFDQDLESQAESVNTGDLSLRRERLSSFASDDSAATRLSTFHHDAVHGLVDALDADDGDDFDSAKLEFMGLRLSNNASDNAMQKAITTAFATHVLELSRRGLEPKKAAEKAFTSKRGVVKFVKEVGLGDEDVSSQVHFVLGLQKALLGTKDVDAGRAGNFLAAVLQQLYNHDVLEEDGILVWWADKRASTGESMARAREKCRVLIEWLENADEEESDEEDED